MEKTCRECEHYKKKDYEEPCLSCRRAYVDCPNYPDNWTAVTDEPEDKPDLIEDMIEAFGRAAVKNYLVCNAFVAIRQSRGIVIDDIKTAKLCIDTLLELEG